MVDRMGPEQRMMPGQFLTSANGMFQFILQGDGNLVIYRSDGVAIWNSQTGGVPVAFANMQADGNFVLYGPAGPIWNTQTNGCPGAGIILQDDGNLVIYAPNGQAVWAALG